MSIRRWSSAARWYGAVVILAAIGWAPAVTMGQQPQQQAQQPPAPRPTTRGDILRGEYGRYRANNDLLYYHLDIRVDPEKKFISGKNTIRFKMLDDDARIQVDLYDTLNVEKILLRQDRVEVPTRELNAVFVDFPETLERDGSTRSTSTTQALRVRPAASAASPFARIPPVIPGSTRRVKGRASSIWWPNKDQWRDEVESMDISVAIPNDLVDASNGKLMGKTDLGDGYTRWDWHVHYPINCVQRLAEHR